MGKVDGYKYLGQNKNVYPNGKIYTKTVYQAPITDDMVSQWSKEAFQDAIDNNNFKINNNKTYIYGTAKNGLKFEGFRDIKTNTVETFYPVQEWTRLED